MIFNFESLTIGGEEIIKLSTVDGYVIWEKKNEDEPTGDTDTTIWGINFIPTESGDVIVYYDKFYSMYPNGYQTYTFTDDGKSNFNVTGPSYSVNQMRVYYRKTTNNIKEESFTFNSNGVYSAIFAKDINYLPSKLFDDNCKNLKEIYYQGTMEEWNNIEKANNWCSPYNSLKTVICTNGTISI